MFKNFFRKVRATLKNSPEALAIAAGFATGLPMFANANPMVQMATRYLPNLLTYQYQKNPLMSFLTNQALTAGTEKLVGTDFAQQFLNPNAAPAELPPGVTPEDIGNLAIEKGIPTIIDYFSEQVVDKILKDYGKAKVITATNVFAHIDDPNHISNLIYKLLDDDGIFISESHYLIPLIDTLQYDTIYHEHLRYYSLSSLRYLLNKNNFYPFKASKISTHGGSIRVFASKDESKEVNPSIDKILDEEKDYLNLEKLNEFKDRVVQSKTDLMKLINDIKSKNQKIFGISAPSRASTLINYVGIDSDLIDCIVEIAGSYKIGKYMPGTRIPVLDEKVLYDDQPEYALLFSWHIADELVPKIKKLGYKGKFIIPLPSPKIID